MDKIFIEQVLAVFYFIIGLSLIVNAEKWKEFMEQMKEIDCLSLGLLFAFVGVFLVMGHNHWELHPSVITTVISWCILIKGAFLMILPKLSLIVVEKINPDQCLIRGEGVVAVVLSAIIFYYSG